ncbi:2-keto-4-carboxy-3-hexenedioate hydratase [subsurface metagenome]
MMIDVFAHILPPKYLEAREKKAISGWASAKGSRWVKAVPTLSDLDIRFRIMDQYQDLLQVLTVAAPPLETITKPEDAVELARIANDEMAELVMKYPDRFVAAIACLPLNDIDATLEEIDRTIKDLRFRGIQIFSDVNGKPLDSPEFLPIYEKMAYYDLPILIHPRREAIVPDYEGEKESKYLVWNRLSWPHATSMAMLRLAGSGVLEHYPNLKFITHHAGGTVPYLITRISLLGEFNEMRMGFRYEQHLTKTIPDYLRMFYNDTAVYGNTPSLMCAYAFCGADHLLFASDMPFDSQTGYRLVRETIRSIEEMDITDTERKKIFEDNARKLLRLPI